MDGSCDHVLNNFDEIRGILEDWLNGYGTRQLSQQERREVEAALREAEGWHKQAADLPAGGEYSNRYRNMEIQYLMVGYCFMQTALTQIREM